MTAVTVTKACAVCGERFEPRPIELLNTNTPRLYCRKACRRVACAQHNAARGIVCLVCNAGVVTRRYGLLLCDDCVSAAYRTCWRKWQCVSEEQALVRGGGLSVVAYDCQLCEWWHASNPLNPHPADLEQRLARIGAALKRLGFEINTARGFTRPWGGVKEAVR